MSDHPPAFLLDGHTAGDRDAGVEAHLATCEACRAYVEALSGDASKSPKVSENDASAWIAKLEQRAEAGPHAEPDPRAPTAPVRDASVLAWRRRAARAAWIATPLLAAAAVLLVVRGREMTDEKPYAGALDDPQDTRFKGYVQLAIIRDRNGEQARVSQRVTVLPGDRLRVEVGVDGEQPIVVGMLGNDGTWIVLLAPALLEAGAYLSERAVRFDDAPTEGVILAGHPDAVERARMSRNFDGVTVVPVARER